MFMERLQKVIAASGYTSRRKAEELIKAGKKTLFDSKANIVFANHPKWAKDKKI